jgi:glycosyltransferase 2 family protein
LHSAEGYHLWEQAPDPGWLALSGVLYILALGCCNFYWYRLLRSLGLRPPGLAIIRSYYIGLMGKYLPGKAWALVARAALAQKAGIRPAVTGVTAIYEVLTTMSTGALLAAVFFALQAPDTLPISDWSALSHILTDRAPDTSAGDRKVLVLIALFLLAILGIPILPFVYNRLARRLRSLKNLAAKQMDAEADHSPLPQMRLAMLSQGVIIGCFSWLFMGASLWAVLHALHPVAELPTLREWGGLSALLALAYVAGFIILPIPSGLGIREFFLRLLLVPELIGQWNASESSVLPTAVLAVVLLRLVWTAAELVMVAIVYWFPAGSPGSENNLQS